MPALRPRRRMIVNREVQYDILMYVGILVASLFTMQIVTAYMFLNQFETIAKNMTAVEFLSRFKISFLVYQSISFGLCLIFGVFIFNRFSSRIAGPIYNMRRVLRKAQEIPGTPISIHLREDDYFHDEIKDINAMLKRKY